MPPPATSFSSPEHGWVRLRWRRLPPQESRRRSARSGRGWGSSSPARSSPRLARSWVRARSTSRTACCSRPRRDHLVFNLPGNPVSVLVTFELFVRPAVNALLGVVDPLPDYRRGVLGAPVTRNAHRDEYVRALARREGVDVVVDPLPGRESHMIARAGRAGALIEVGAGDGEIAAGEEVRYLPLA